MMIQQIIKIKRKFSKDTHLSEIAKQSAFSFGMRVFGLLVNYLFLFFVTRYFGAKGWGIFAICFSLLQIGAMIGTMGINVGFVKVIPQGYTNVRQLYYQVLKFILPLNIVLTAIVFFGAEIIGNFFDKDGVQISQYIRIASLGILPFSISMLNSGLFRGNKEILFFSFFDSLGRFLFGGVVVFVLYQFSQDVAVIINGFVIGLYILALFSFKGINKILKKHNDVENADQKIYTFRELYKLSNSLFWTNFIYQGSLWATTLILGAYLSKEQVGIFDATNRFASLLTIVGYAINSIAAPRFAESVSDKKILGRNVQASSKLLFFATIPLFFFMVIAGPFILDFLGYSNSGVNAYLIFIVILLGQLVNNLSGLVGILMQMTGHHMLSQKVSIGSFVFTTVLLFFITPVYGLMGASIITGLNIALKNIVSVILVYSKTGVLTVYMPFRR